MTKTKIAHAADLAEGHTIKFPFTRNGKPAEGFLVRYQKQLVAYENKCRHLPVSLDFHDGRFFTQDGEYLICFNHNAIYEPLTGLCVRGPCEGQSLMRLKIEEVDGEVWLIT